MTIVSQYFVDNLGTVVKKFHILNLYVNLLDFYVFKIVLTSTEVLIHEMANVVKNYGTEELIKYLWNKDLKLAEAHFEILCEEKITGFAFLETTKENFWSYGFKGGPTIVLTNVIADLKKSKSQNQTLNLYLFSWTIPTYLSKHKKDDI